MNEMTLPDTGFEIQALVVLSQTRYMYLSVGQALHDIEYLRVSEIDISCFFETWMSERARDETHDLRLFKQAAFI